MPPIELPPFDVPPFALEPAFPPPSSSFDSLSPPHETSALAPTSVAPNVKSAARPRRALGSRGAGELTRSSPAPQNGQLASVCRT
jgi:hypothetical protein